MRSLAIACSSFAKVPNSDKTYVGLTNEWADRKAASAWAYVVLPLSTSKVAIPAPLPNAMSVERPSPISSACDTSTSNSFTIRSNKTSEGLPMSIQGYVGSKHCEMASAIEPLPIARRRTGRPLFPSLVPSKWPLSLAQAMSGGGGFPASSAMLRRLTTTATLRAEKVSSEVTTMLSTRRAHGAARTRARAAASCLAETKSRRGSPLSRTVA
mmetsp:Transcript_16695/g.50657  ORF Transcript_16695/g.50657 Transcript_16695/m.50657 type:complete len:212 (+) Transcript_16695:410-1045(+)|eukprot:scaffold279836_cov31-Tisochrysis_lutea.AAC.1